MLERGRASPWANPCLFTISVHWGGLISDGLTDICNCRVAFATNLEPKQVKKNSHLKLLKNVKLLNKNYVKTSSKLSNFISIVIYITMQKKKLWKVTRFGIQTTPVTAYWPKIILQFSYLYLKNRIKLFLCWKYLIWNINKPKMAYSRDRPIMARQEWGIMDQNCSDT